MPNDNTDLYLYCYLKYNKFSAAITLGFDKKHSLYFFGVFGQQENQC